MLLNMTGRQLPSPQQVIERVPCLAGLLLIAARSVSRVYNEEMRGSGLEITQHVMLAMLRELGPMTHKDLGARMSLDKTTVSRAVRVLHRNGWVSLDRGEDGRERIVGVTTEGLAVLEAARPAWDRAQARMRAAMSVAEFDLVRGRLPKVVAATRA